MIHHHITQGTAEWLKLRMGKPTASQFNRIITPTGKASSQSSDYINELLGELMLGRPLDGANSPWMDRGKELEAEARRFYSFERDVQLELAGFCTTDDGLVGASPDAFCGEDGLVEIKCPSPGVHVGYLLDAIGGADRSYMPQLQGQLYVTGRAWVDIISYHPELPPAIVRVERDEKYIAELARLLGDFLAVLEVRRLKLEARGWIKDPAPDVVADWLGITDQDIEDFSTGAWKQ